ncbi:LOB domain-containing protein 7-like protein [Carex littledalei]|uniref:LOB domain-containing protein 7-like protein n=1 Tax=Carex littledalei TaxID=544730 RepID=A0A833VMU6_9POAL|nr:LOB domain-containing protein 7-like protein [Carex littledalei]
MGAQQVSGGGGACAACKHQRRKCEKGCELANYFPSEKMKEFKAVHKVFGVSNLAKLIKANSTEQARHRAAATLTWEAEWREKEPVEGCYKEVQMLRCEIQRLREILARCTCGRSDGYRVVDYSNGYWGLGGGMVILKNNEQQVLVNGITPWNQMM